MKPESTTKASPRKSDLHLLRSKERRLESILKRAVRKTAEAADHLSECKKAIAKHVFIKEGHEA